MSAAIAERGCRCEFSYTVIYVCCSHFLCQALAACSASNSAEHTKKKGMVIDILCAKSPDVLLVDFNSACQFFTTYKGWSKIRCTLLRISWYSDSAVLSSTMPPPPQHCAPSGCAQMVRIKILKSLWPASSKYPMEPQ